MRATDLTGVFALQCSAYPPGYHEAEDALASRLMAGEGLCFVAEAGAALIGYVFAHPWSGPPPALHAALPVCPPAPDHLFIHDLAVCPHRRGHGAAQCLIDAVLAAARARMVDCVRLVAVGPALAFWRRHGFHAQPGEVHHSYGEARYMGKVLP